MLFTTKNISNLLRGEIFLHGALLGLERSTDGVRLPGAMFQAPATAGYYSLTSIFPQANDKMLISFRTGGRENMSVLPSHIQYSGQPK